MALTITKSGPFFTAVGSAISFSTLRENFILTAEGSVSASVLIRDVIPSQREPIVPDATENSGISSTQSNLSLSQFRNSIKYYNVTHTGTETNYNVVGSVDWNGNLNKTIVKSVYLTGTYGSSNPASPAATFEGDTHNVRLYVSGSVLGAGGASGSGDGGDALKVNSSTGAVTVIPTDTSKLYGGGGGGARGADGLQGLDGSCSFYTYYNAAVSCGTDPVCGSDFLNSKTASGSCNCSTTYTEVWFPPPDPPFVYVGSVVSYSPPSYTPSCPDPDTLILMTDGTQKRAGDLNVGDYVKTQHETTLEWGDYPVLNVSIVGNNNKLKLIFDGTHIICSNTHKMYVDGKGWKCVTDIEIGDSVSGYLLKEVQDYEKGDVVAITIDKAHAFISNGLLSHNLVGKGGSCPDPEMPILMADGTEKKAGDIEVGDEVLTQHEKTLEWGVYRVIQKNILQQNKYKMIFESDNSNKEVICSDSHCFYVDGKEWTSVWKMNVGDIVSGYRLISSEKIGDGPIVQIGIDEAHTYICAGLLSHNKLVAPSPPRYVANSCPDPNTLILMSDGIQKRAGDLEVGDFVRTIHETTHEWGDYEITHVEIVRSDRITLTFDHSQFVCSPSHKFYVLNEGWKEAQNLNIGDVIESGDNTEGHCLLNKEVTDYGDVVIIQVDEAHTYISDGMLSHNKTYAQPYYAPPPRRRRRRDPRPRPRPRGRKSDIRLKKNIRQIGLSTPDDVRLMANVHQVGTFNQNLNIIQKYWNI